MSKADNTLAVGLAIIDTNRSTDGGSLHSQRDECPEYSRIK